MEQQKINLHTHTTFCDGKNTPEDMILSAIDKGFTTLGFSSHSLFPFARSWHIASKEFSNYETTICHLKEKYADKIQILLGYEVDYYPGVSKPSKSFYKSHGLLPDYIIGSVHYVVSKKGYYAVDNSTLEVQCKLVDLYSKDGTFKGVNGKKAVCEYFAAEREMLKNPDFEILGHPDLIRKRNGELKFFDEKAGWYLKELKATAKAISKAGVIVEINTGAIARGAMDDTYPSSAFLDYLHSYNVPVCINSDCHNSDDLDCAYDRAIEIAKKAGYSELIYPAKESTISIKI